MYICGMKMITQYETRRKYYLDTDGFIHTNNCKIKNTTITTTSGPKTMTRDKWICVVYMNAPIDGNFYTKRKPDGSLIWKHKRDPNWISLNTYVPEIDDNRKTYIYYLCDSRDGVPKYIGKTVNPKDRFKAHKLDANHYNNHKTNWINKILKSGGTIEMHVIDVLEPNGIKGSGDWRWLEEYWAQQFIVWGFQIIVDGGWGNGGMKRKATKTEILKQQQIHTMISGKKKYLYELYSEKVHVFDSVRGLSRFLVNLGYRDGRATHKDGTFIGSDFIVKDYEITQEEKEQLLNNSKQVRKKVVQLSKNFEVVTIFNSLRDAIRKYGQTVASVIDKNKVHNSAKGFYFIYLNEYTILSKTELIKKFTKKMSPKCYSITEIKYIRENPDNLTIKEMSEKMSCSHGTIDNIRKRIGMYKLS